MDRRDVAGSTLETDLALRNFFNSFVNLPIDERVANVALTLRKKHKIKLPNTINHYMGDRSSGSRVLVTRNTKDFSDKGLEHLAIEMKDSRKTGTTLEHL